MKLTLPLITAVNFSLLAAILEYAKLWQEFILHQTTCDSINRVSFFACAIDHLGVKGGWIKKIRSGITFLWFRRSYIFNLRTAI